MSDFPFQGSHLRELSVEKQEVSVDRAQVFSQLDPFPADSEEVRLTVTKDIKSASWRCATAVCRNNNDNAPANSMAGFKEWLGRQASPTSRTKGSRTRPSSARGKGKKTERNAEKKARGEKRVRLELNNPEIWGAN
jgi:hypothetical protein